MTHRGILMIAWATSIWLRWFLNHFECKTLMKISKSNSLRFIVKKSKYSGKFFLSKAEIDHLPVRDILVILHPTKFKWDNSWPIGKLTERPTTFTFYSRANLASIIKKVAVEIGPKIEQSWDWSWKCKIECNEDPWGNPQGIELWIPDS